MASVELSALHKRYGAVQVVKGLSLSIASGELVALLGPSGCGKTTTLRMLAGLERVDSGVIRIDGQVVDGDGRHVPTEARGLGMVFQSYAVFPHRTVAQNVDYPLKLKGLPSTERAARVAEALGWVRLTELAARLPQALSGGQLQRVAIARALVAKPRVLLLDEPLSNLDARLREELRGEIASLRAKLGTTMVFVTHDQSEALALADRVAVMNAGVIEQLGTPETIYREPATPFVASFVGGANLLLGEVLDGHFVTGAHRFPLPEPTPAGRGTLVVRPEEVEVGVAGTALPLSARLFAGSATEYRFMVGEAVLRAVGPASGAKSGEEVPVRFTRVRFFPS